MNLILRWSAAAGLAVLFSILPFTADAKRIATGSGHSCALTPAGGVMCWGSDRKGQLGDAASHGNAVPAPVAVSGLDSGVQAIVAGAYHTCALKAGVVYCWGDNYSGQLGIGNTNSQSTPQVVQGLPDPASNPVIDIAAGFQFTCAVDSSGQIWCWGANDYHQLNNGGVTASATPVLISVANTAAAAIVTGGAHACALLADGELVCWGDNSYGNLGLEVFGGTLPGSVRTAGIDDFLAFTRAVAGGFHTCAVVVTLGAESRVWCWGGNFFGQLGNNSTANSALPVPVDGPGQVSALALGWIHTCAIDGAGAVWCWGDNTSGQLGRSDVAFSATALKIDSFGNDNLEIAAGEKHTCVLKTSGAVFCTGGNDSGQIGNNTADHYATTPLKIPGLAGISTISVGHKHACAIKPIMNGFSTTYCWGKNSEGQLGDDTYISRAVPAPVSHLLTAAQISAGGQHTCSIDSGGGVQCWGDDDMEQLGNGSGGGSLIPVPVIDTQLTAPVARLTAGWSHTCATIYQPLGEKKVLCWGYGGLGELGTGNSASSNQPVPTAGPQAATAIDAEGGHTCMISPIIGSPDKHVWCWGWNSDGQVGNGQPASDGVLVPFDVTAQQANLPLDVTGIATGRYHTCALSPSLGVWCWGYGNHGLLGNGSINEQPNPVKAQLPDAGGLSIAAGIGHTCARYASGWSCWGVNQFGQLGDGTRTQTGTAVPVMHAQLPDGSAAGQIDAGGNTTCALSSLEEVWCWGDGYWGQLGDGQTGFVTAPAAVVGFPAGGNADSIFRDGFEEP